MSVKVVPDPRSIGAVDVPRKTWYPVAPADVLHATVMPPLWAAKVAVTPVGDAGKVVTVTGALESEVPDPLMA